MKLITDGKKLRGSAMPGIVTAFQQAVVGKRIVKAGYAQLMNDEQEVWPCLILDDGSILVVQCDDEANGPGVMTATTQTGEAVLCETSLRP